MLGCWLSTKRPHVSALIVRAVGCDRERHTNQHYYIVLNINVYQCHITAGRLLFRCELLPEVVPRGVRAAMVDSTCARGVHAGPESVLRDDVRGVRGVDVDPPKRR